MTKQLEGLLNTLMFVVFDSLYWPKARGFCAYTPNRWRYSLGEIPVWRWKTLRKKATS